MFSYARGATIVLFSPSPQRRKIELFPRINSDASRCAGATAPGDSDPEMDQAVVSPAPAR